MVTEFLKDLEQELMTSKREIEDAIQSISIRQQETEKFRNLIASETEDVFSEFTPRDVSSKNREKISELNTTLTDILAQMEEKQEELSHIMEQIDRVHAAEQEVSRENEEILKNDDAEVKEKLRQVLSYLPADPMRAKVELEALVTKD